MPLSELSTQLLSSINFLNFENINLVALAITAGILGGSVKAMYTAWINYTTGQITKIWKFFLTLFISMLIGGAIGYLFSFDYKVAGLAGFAGIDILTNVAKASIASKKFTMNRK